MWYQPMQELDVTEQRGEGNALGEGRATGIMIVTVAFVAFVAGTLTSSSVFGDVTLIVAW